MAALSNYVGRIVRLNQQAFRQLAVRASRHGCALENCFLVASVSRASRKLTCYGASFRIDIPASDVVLI